MSAANRSAVGKARRNFLFSGYALAASGCVGYILKYGNILNQGNESIGVCGVGVEFLRCGKRTRNVDSWNVQFCSLDCYYFGSNFISFLEAIF